MSLSSKQNESIIGGTHIKTGETRGFTDTRDINGRRDHINNSDQDHSGN
ncbi:MAG: hypothetical protein AAFO82_11580 [Bacteroidota bacterium]